jgi:hypothetical protein
VDPVERRVKNLTTSQEFATLQEERYVMHALAIAVFAVSIASAALAQHERSARDMMNDMKARHGQTFEQCQALATSRGYRLGVGGGDDDGESRALMMFIEGCIMGKQR